MYAAIVGLDIDPDKPGYKHIIIRPNVGGGLQHASGKLRSVHGTIESAWRIDGNMFRLDLTIPPNTTATVHIPFANEVREIEAGRYEFTANFT
jgi:alpha-L-rhamnosidase